MKDGIAGISSTTKDRGTPSAGGWKFALEIFPAGWNLPNAPFWIAGWILSGSGAGAADVRVWFGRNLFLGLCGLPRPEIETVALGRLGPPHAGFSFLLPPDPDASELRFEACDASGRWQEFHRQGIECATAEGAPRATPKVLEEAKISRALLRLLMMRQSNPSISWETPATEALLEAVAVPLDALPNPPFFGRLEFPQRIANVKFGLLEISGWLAHRSERIVRLLAFIGADDPVTLLHGRPRGDVPDVFGELRDGPNSQFIGFIEVPPALPQPLALRILVQLESGEQHLAFCQRFVPQVIVDSPAALPRFSPLTFGRAVVSLRAVSERLALPVEPSRLGAAAALALAVYRAESPKAQPQIGRPRSPSVRVAAARSMQVLLVTHNLNREGAPLIALEYAKHLAAQPGWQVEVVSPENGPLADDFRAGGLSAEIVSASAVWRANSAEEFEEAIGQLASLPCCKTADLIVANTMVAFWAVHVARHLNKPSILYVHESASVQRFFAALAAPFLLGKIEAAFGEASRVAFAAAASQSTHLHLERHGNFCVVPGWINTAAIAAYISTHAKEELRRAKNIPANAVVFVNVGSVCERKGQHVFLQAIEILRDNVASKKQVENQPLVFFMVGASPGPFVDFLRHESARRQLSDVHFVEAVSNPYEYFRIADICVCSSFEESLPRVVMEAAAFGVPVVATAVNGVPEILGPEEAWLVPAGHARQLAEAMELALDAHLRGDRGRAERAQRRVRENFDAALLLPEHRRLAIEVATTTAR